MMTEEEASLKAYSSSAFRSFKTFIGELTAVAAGIYVGIQEVVPVIESSGTEDPWKVAALKHGVIVNALRSEQVMRSSVRLNLVSLYSGFDLFITDVRSQFYDLHGQPWVQHDGDTPFEALARNTASTSHVHQERLGAHRIAAMNYYRLVRNAIAHPRPEAIEASKSYFATNSKLLGRAREEYGMQSAPNEIHQQTFHDIKFLARVALDLTKAIDLDLDPGDKRLSLLLASQVTDPRKSRERKRNALIGWLRTCHGVSAERAELILSMRNDPSA